jgi:hypothetical protein
VCFLTATQNADFEIAESDFAEFSTQLDNLLGDELKAAGSPSW